MVVRQVALVALAAAAFACGKSQSPGGDDKARGGSGASGGSAGSSGTAGSGGTPGPVCTPASEDVAPGEPGIHARIDGEMNHFVRDVQAFVGALAPDDGFGFSTSARKEPGVCGQLTFGLAVIPGGDTLEVGTYECEAIEPHLASGTYIVTVGGVAGSSYDGGGCSIELSEVGTGAGAEIAGSFTGILGSASGETLATDGEFRVTITE